MKKFEVPMMDIQRFDTEDIIYTSKVCAVEAFNCPSCYCVAVDCGEFTCDANNFGCPDDTCPKDID
ncbi:MAG: hypothetical protein IJQ62_08410 [Clostridia bacterium]|nr:hypothetical protein [Clostridia bacterium]